MPLRNKITLALVLWVAVEFAAFGAVVDRIGLGNALLLGLATTLIGGSLLKRAGLSALTRLRREAEQGRMSVFQGAIGREETLAGIAALLLLVPGFVTDAIGLLLALMTPRVWLAGLFGRPSETRETKGANERASGAHRPQGPQIIDLDPGEYRTIDEPRR